MLNRSVVTIVKQCFVYSIMSTSISSPSSFSSKSKRKREIGLVVPAKFTAFTKEKRHAQIFSGKLSEKNNILPLTVIECDDIVKLPNYDIK